METVDCCRMDGQGHARHGAQLSEAEQTVRALRDAPQLQQEHAERQHGGQALRQKRGIGCAGHAPVQHGDEIPVQHDIQQRGKNQEIQRDARFSERIEQGGQDIIEKEKGQTIEIDVQIGDCDLQRVGRSLQGDHDLLTAQQPDTSQQDADGQKRQQGGVDGGLHAGKALRAEMLADDDGGADAAADGHTDEDRCERGGRADGRPAPLHRCSGRRSRSPRWYRPAGKGCRRSSAGRISKAPARAFR